MVPTPSGKDSEGPMKTLQPGIFAVGTTSHRHLEFKLRPGRTRADVARAMVDLDQCLYSLAEVNSVLGVGPSTWALVAPEHVPGATASFPGYGSGRWTAPSTQRDLWVWLHGSAQEADFDGARAVCAAVSSAFELGFDQHGFLYRGGRDLSGFIDGTENPPVRRVARELRISSGDPGAGGTFALTQKWIHDMVAFGALDIGAQEAVIGRTRADSVELGDGNPPPDSHVARAVQEGPDDEDFSIYRRSIPFGDLGEMGLMFVAFAPDSSRFDRILRRMFGMDPDGLHDRLIQFSRPVTGSYWFVPTLEQLTLLADN